MITYLLTAVLALLFLYGWLQARTSKLLAIGMMLACCVGVTFVWFPDLSQRLAHFVGVGRGADLVTYIWIICSLFVSFNLHLEVRRERKRFTELVRQLALREQPTAAAEAP
jgi:hypothetical protein